MPSYKVVLKDKTELRVSADDVDLTPCLDAGEGHDCQVHQYNFLKNQGDDDEITVAAIPFSEVESITS